MTWGSASRAQRPFTTEIVRRQFPSLRGTTWRSNGRSSWNGSHFEHIRAFYVEITNIHGVKLKMSSYKIVIKTDLSGFVPPINSGSDEQYVKCFGLTPSGFDFCFVRALVYWDTINARISNYNHKFIWGTITLSALIEIVWILYCILNATAIQLLLQIIALSCFWIC